MMSHKADILEVLEEKRKELSSESSSSSSCEEVDKD